MLLTHTAGFTYDIDHADDRGRAGHGRRGGGVQPRRQDAGHGGRGGQVELWSVATRQRLGKPMPAGPGTTVLAFSPDGDTLATAASDGSVRLWNVTTQQEIGAAMTADAQPVYAAAFSPGGSMLVTAGGDGSVRLWDVATQRRSARR